MVNVDWILFIFLILLVINDLRTSELVELNFKIISKIKSLVIIDSLNGFFNLLEDRKDTGQIINSFIMLLVSSAKNANSIVVIGSLSKLINENEWVLYNTGRHIIENKHMTKIQLTKSNGNIIVKNLKPDKSKNTVIFS